jgi:hypothetical protein
MHNERRREQRPGHHDQVPARRRGLRPRHHSQVPATRNEETAWAPRSSTCDAQRAAQQAATWALESNTCHTQRAAPRAMA